MSSVSISKTNDFSASETRTNLSRREQPPAAVGKILIIARNTFREAVRDRVLYNLVLFVLLLTAAAIFLGELTAGHEARTIVNFGLSAMLVFGAFIAIFVGVGLVSKEIEKRTVYAIFAKPVARGEFLIGKYLGLCATLAANVALMGLGVMLALFYVGGGALAGAIWWAIFLIFWQLAILTAVAILFSSFSSPNLSAALTFFVFIIGHFSTSLRDFADTLGSAGAKILFNFLFYFLPNLTYFSFISQAAHGKTPLFSHVFGAVVYGVVYITLLLSAAVLIFSRRNFK